MSMLKKFFIGVLVVILLFLLFKIGQLFVFHTESVGATNIDRYNFQTYLMDDGKVIIYGGYTIGVGGRITVNEVEIFDPTTKEFYLTDNQVLDEINLERVSYGITYNLGEIIVKTTSNLFVIKDPEAYIKKHDKLVMITDVYDLETKAKLGRFFLPRPDNDLLAFGFDDRLLLISGKGKSKKKEYGSLFLHFKDIDLENRTESVYSHYERIYSLMNNTRYNKFLGVKLSNGKVLVYGGQDIKGGFWRNGELFDPQTNEFKLIKGRTPGAPRGNMIELKDGSVLIIAAGGEASEIVPADLLN